MQPGGPSSGAYSKMSQWVLLMGGVTFLATNLTGLLTFLVLREELDWAVFTLLKLEVLLPQLAWHWISVEQHIRRNTDAMFLAALRMAFTRVVWPQRLRSWAAQL